MIDEDLDADLERRAVAEGTSKAAIIRAELRQHLRPLAPLSSDPLWRMGGVDDFEPEPIDDVVYR